MFRKASSAQSLAKRADALRERMNADQKCALARDIAKTLDQSELNSTERAIAEDIIEKLVEDEIVTVRAAVAESVAASPHLPGRLAKRLAEDISEVAIPVLKLSPALEEKVLEDIISGGAIDKMRAIAEREIVSEGICRRIVATGRKGPVIRLLENPGAHITNQTMITIVRVYGDDKTVEQAVFDRGQLPDEVINALCELVEAHIVSFVQRYFNLPEHVINIQKGRNLLNGIKEKRRHTDTEPEVSGPSDWWDSKKGVK